MRAASPAVARHSTICCTISNQPVLSCRLRNRLALGAGYDRDSGGSLFRGGNAVPTANKNQARKMYQGAFSMVRNGIGSEIGSTANTPIMARHPEITNNAIFG